MDDSRSETLTRRGLLRAGAALALSAAVAPRSRAARWLLRPARPAGARNVILLWMNGGPSHLDTFDPKPGTKYSGPFASIATAVDGIRFCEHLPLLAERARHLALLRSVHSLVADHARADALMHTGVVPSSAVPRPSFLVSAAAELVDPSQPLPSSVVIGAPRIGAGFLGEPWEPFVIPQAASAARVLCPPGGLTEARRSGRRELLERWNRGFAERGGAERIATADAIWRKAAQLSRPDVSLAFDLHAEPPESAAAYGDSDFGRGCLLARRLIEHGVRFVEVRMEGFDTHSHHFDLTPPLLRTMDQAFAALLDDLAQRGLLDETLMVWAGEFGRSPEINREHGRDHHWQCFSVALAGGGVVGGQAIGASDATGHEIVERPIAVADLFATIYAALGLDPGRTFTTPAGQPLARLEGGTALDAVLGAP